MGCLVRFGYSAAKFHCSKPAQAEAGRKRLWQGLMPKRGILFFPKRLKTVRFFGQGQARDFPGNKEVASPDPPPGAGKQGLNFISMRNIKTRFGKGCERKNLCRMRAKPLKIQGFWCWFKKVSVAFLYLNRNSTFAPILTRL
ncbi:MAG: hypothetical protein D6714_02620 [Bacteroidetes bacterium]|nr:MAG: hypothetical protein D6714_02620 [Bacteroidota bacterium]